MNKTVIYFLAMISLLFFVVSSNAQTRSNKENKKSEITLGIVTSGDNPNENLKKVSDLGFSYCQLSIAEYTPALAKELREAMAKYNVQATTLICMGPGAYKWDFLDGPVTIGLVPREFREERIKRLQDGIDFCVEVGIPAVHAHFGFIPENPKDTLYAEFVEAMKKVGNYAKERNIDIYFETGQETPITLVRAINDIGTGNLFINCDLANLVMYGKSNPMDGLKIMKDFVKEFHAKDGSYPDPFFPNTLGKEKPIPEGEVDFPAIIRFLKEINFEGTLVIEHELAVKDYDYILKTKKFLENLINQ